MEYDLLIINGDILPAADGDLVSGPCYVAISGNRIAALGRLADLPAPLRARRTVDASGGLIMPGLINCHCHAAMTLFRGLADDLPLMRWLTEHIFPAEARFVDPEMVYWCSKLAAAEMILSGTTTVADGYFHEDQAADAFCEAGLRAVAAQGVIDFPAPGVPEPAGNVAAAAAFVERWQGKNELVTPAVFCHSPYTCGPETLKRAKAKARERSVPLFIHLAETENEAAQIREQHHCSPVRYLAGLGLLDQETVCIHCVWLDEEDIGILAASGARTVSCPASNMKLAAGTAPLPAMVAAGIVCGLGTDSCASNNALDLFREMDGCAKLHKVTRLDPTVMPARRVLALATSGGAGVLGLGSDLGRLAVGALADLIIVDRRTPRLTPFHHADLLVYAASGSDVASAVINGTLVMEQRRILSFDVAEAMARVRGLAAAVRAAT